MTPPIIQVRGLGKRYRLGATLRHTTLRDQIAAATARLARRKAPRREGPSEIWALRDVELDVAEGEVVGIVGRNGAGKSTLLKILSRITEPTVGEVRLRGRVASLLEVGTGFHPELSGRENIFLNGAILGMRRAEIRAKFDEIVAFAGVEDFIDTPVKRYSSGMHVRLAFAVAAHLEPEILLVDEVLAVGDAEFQRRCLGKMDDVARSGRTILFVSHNMAAVENLCRRAVLLVGGRVDREGDPQTVIGHYLGESTAEEGDVDLARHPGRRAGVAGVLTRFRLLDPAGAPLAHVPLGGDAVLEVSGCAPRRIENAALNIRIDGAAGQRVAVLHTDFQYARPFVVDGPFRLACMLRNCRLMPGPYRLELTLKSPVGLEDQVDGLWLTVTPRDVYGTGRMLPGRTGSYVPEVDWRVESPAAGREAGS